MNKAIEVAGGAYVASKALGQFKFRYIIYGVAAYFALRTLSKRGIFPKQTEAALGVIDQGLQQTKEKLGLHSSTAGENSLPH